MAIPVLTVEDPTISEASAFALVWALGLPGAPETTHPADFLAELLSRVSSQGDSFLPAGRKASVRDMLRFGAYKPSGRAKPSSEYLLAAAVSGTFPLVNAPVDANNAVSLAWGYPASVFDLGKTGMSLRIRRGREGESYAFNRSGQEIDLRDLVVVCGSSGAPCGNPVKDAMATKVFGDVRDAVSVVYAPAADVRGDLARCADRLKALFLEECGAREAGFSVIG